MKLTALFTGTVLTWAIVVELPDIADVLLGAVATGWPVDPDVDALSSEAAGAMSAEDWERIWKLCTSHAIPNTPAPPATRPQRKARRASCGRLATRFPL